MIEVLEYDDGLPISVIVPLSENRRHFFENMVLPLLEANMVKEIIINSNSGGAPKKRNDGLKRATQEYVLFCDDDILFPKDYIEKVYKFIVAEREKSGNVGYVYTGYHGIVMHPESHPMRGNFSIDSRKFNGDLLRKGNFISTMSLVCRACLGDNPFDEKLKRLQDWSLWLTLLGNGCYGSMFPDTNMKFYAFYLDEGITSNSNSENDALMAVATKHKLI